MTANRNSMGVQIPQDSVSRVVNGVYSYSSPGNTADDWFGPGSPLAPAAPPSVAGRQYDYPVAYNLQITPRQGEAVSFGQMRALADGLDIMRIVIETRKDQLSRLKWKIAAREDAKVSDARLRELTAFFRKPDKRHRWGDWLRALAEDMLVIDAACIYPRRDRSGALYALELMDGATIQRKLAPDGRTPEPPEAAYQQVLHGLPAVNYTLDELIYRPRNVRTWRVYGYSPVEQVIMTVNIALRRQLHQLQYYTEGNIPEALIGVPESWQPSQIKEFQEYWDWLLEGNTAARRHAKFVPGGIKIAETKAGVIKDEFDEWIARVICFCFSLPPTAFVKEMNRATAEQSAESAQAEGQQPVTMWVKDTMDDILESRLDAADCEFAWVEEKSVDPLVQAQVDKLYVDMGAQTPKQIAEARGFDYEKPPPASAVPAAAGLPGAAIAPGMQPAVPGTSPPAEAGTQAAGEPAPSAEEPSKPLAKAAGAGRTNRKWKQLAPIPVDRPQTRRGAEQLAKLFSPFLKKEGKRIAGEIVRKVEAAGGLAEGAESPDGVPAPTERGTKKTLEKADEPSADEPASTGKGAESTGVRAKTKKRLLQETAESAGIAAKVKERLSQSEIDEIIDSIDLKGWAVLVDPAAEVLEQVFRDTQGRALLQVGITEKDITELPHEEAVAWARERAAELVGMRVDRETGELIENPNPEWAITETTREMLREQVTRSLEEGTSSQALAQEIEESTGFSSYRSEMIARTEIGNAHNEGSLEGYRKAAALGITIYKQWITSQDEPDDECAENAEAGPIPLDEMFPSGDDCPPAHPNCKCTILGVVIEPEDVESGEEPFK